MSIYAKFDDSRPVNDARAVVLRNPADQAAHTIGYTDIPVADTMPALDAELDPRYKAGGSTTWERPAASG
jgi:hypothetical protein